MFRYAILVLFMSVSGLITSTSFHVLGFCALTSNFILGAVLALYIAENWVFFQDYQALLRAGQAQPMTKRAKEEKQTEQYIQRLKILTEETEEKQIEQYIQRLKILTEETWCTNISDIRCFNIQKKPSLGEAKILEIK